MDYEIIVERGCLRAKLLNRETIEETQEFLRIVAQENRVHRCSRILLDVRASRPIFHVERHELLEHFRKLSADGSRQIALVGDTKELRLSHDYIALLAQQQGLDVRSFHNEAEALRRDRRQGLDRRQLGGDRRQRDRRASVENDTAGAIFNPVF